MVGPCGRILPQWLRAPCNGVSKTDIVSSRGNDDRAGVSGSGSVSGSGADA